LHFWNLETYGKWMILSAIPSYLSMADLGLVVSAGNKMTILMGQKNTALANQIFQSALVFIGLLSAVLALIILPSLFFFPLPWLENMDQRFALAFMILGVLVSFFGGLSEAAFKSSQRNAFGITITSFTRIGEWFGCILGLALIGSFTSVALGGLMMRLFGCLVAIHLVSRCNNSLRWGIKNASLVELKSMIKPSMSFAAFSLANLFSFQSITIFVGLMFGAVATALFSTYRTIARTAVQITAIFSHALWPEFSFLYGEGNKQSFRKLYLKTSFLGALISFLLSIFIFLLSPWLLKIWTHDQIQFDTRLMCLMMIYAAVCGLWHIPRVFMMSTNNHIKLSFWNVLSGLIAVFLSWVFGNFFGLQGIILAMIISELFIALICFYLIKKLFKNC